MSLFCYNNLGDNMKINTVVTGFLEENCYVIKDDKNKECLVIDPGADFENIKKEIGDYKVLNVLLTHDHFDHVGALREVMNEYKVDVLDFDNLEEKEYVIGSFSFKVIFTPGHTSNSISFYFEKEKVMFTGDFLFEGTIGRTDLPTGDLSSMQKSLDAIKKYPHDITIYPGHGDMSILEKEFVNNPYF